MCRNVVRLALGVDRPIAHIKMLEECVSDEAVARLARALTDVSTSVIVCPFASSNHCRCGAFAVLSTVHASG